MFDSRNNYNRISSNLLCEDKMPVKTEVIADIGLFLTRAIGKVVDQDAFQLQESMINSADFSPKLNTLMDARLVTENLLSPETLIHLSSSTPFESSVKRVYVVSDEKESMFATLFGSTSSDNNKFFVTYDIDDACEWLGISFDDIKTSSVYKDDE